MYAVAHDETKVSRAITGQATLCEVTCEQKADGRRDHQLILPREWRSDTAVGFFAGYFLHDLLLLAGMQPRGQASRNHCYSAKTTAQHAATSSSVSRLIARQPPPSEVDDQLIGLFVHLFDQSQKPVSLGRPGERFEHFESELGSACSIPPPGRGGTPI